MKLQALYFLAVLVASSITEEKAPLLAADSPVAIKGEYIVIFKTELEDNEVKQHRLTIRGLLDRYGNESKMLFEYDISKNFRGYSAKLSDKLVDMIRSMPQVRYVEQNQEVTLDQADCKNQETATWGLVRTSLRDWPPQQFDYSYSEEKGAGEGVIAYVLDTGIDTSHPDYNGRAEFGHDTVDNPSPETDLHGHGTHVAGTIMSETYGVAKKATAVAVRVLNANGGGTAAGVAAGINWTADEQKNDPDKKSVANMSLGFVNSQVINEAVNAAVETGVLYAVSGGNEGYDSCNKSPAGAELTITAAASDIDDNLASFSNYGTCINIIAPGVNVLSTHLNGGTASFSGTSMAAPHVAGVMAKILSDEPTTIPRQVMLEKLQETATKDKIKGLEGVKSDTPNLLVFNECV